MVRTSILVGEKFVYENTIAEGRVQAIKQAERIGEFSKDYHRDVRAFLESHLPDSLKALYINGQRGALSAAAIYSIDD